MPWIFFYFFFVLGLSFFFKEELVKDGALFLFSSFVVCVLLLYTPNPPRALACTKGNPDEFFCITFEGRMKEPLGKRFLGCF